MEKLLTCSEVAERFGVKVSTVWSWVRLKKIKTVKINRQYRFRQSDIDEFEKVNQEN